MFMSCSANLSQLKWFKNLMRPGDCFCVELIFAAAVLVFDVGKVGVIEES